MTKTLEELRQSPYHQQLGQKICAAFVAQQQGISLNTALKKVPEPVGDLWLVVAEFARQGYANANSDYLSELVQRSDRLVM